MANNTHCRERMMRRRMEAAAGRMSARRRAIFLAVAVENASYAEIGRRVGLEPVEVEQAFARALVELAAAMDPRPGWWRRLARWFAGRVGR